MLAVLALLPCAAARADECAVLARRIIDVTGATVERRTNASDSYVVFVHPAVPELGLHCRGLDARTVPAVFAAYLSPKPPEAYFTLAAMAAAAILGQRPAAIRALALKCHRASARDPNETATIETKTLRVECTVNRNGGNTTVRIAGRLPN